MNEMKLETEAWVKLELNDNGVTKIINGKNCHWVDLMDMATDFLGYAEKELKKHCKKE